MSVIGDNIRRIRENRNITQHELAEMVGKNPRTISSWECGTRNPSGKDLRRVADALEIAPAEIIGHAEKGDNVFEYIVTTDDMSPELQHGDTLTVNKSVKPKDGDLVIVSMQGRKNDLVRRLYRIGHYLSLLAINPAIKPINTEADNIEIKGTVTEMRRKV